MVLLDYQRPSCYHAYPDRSGINYYGFGTDGQPTASEDKMADHIAHEGLSSRIGPYQSGEPVAVIDFMFLFRGTRRPPRIQRHASMEPSGPRLQGSKLLLLSLSELC